MLNSKVMREQLKQLVVEYYQSVVPNYKIDESKLKYDELDDREILQYDGMIAEHVKGVDVINLFDMESEWPGAVKSCGIKGV